MTLDTIAATRPLPWAQLGVEFTTPLYSAKAALTAAGLDQMTVAKKRSGWVEEDADGALVLGGIAADDMLQTVRMDTRAALGQVGAGYEVIQNLIAFSWMERLGYPFVTMGEYRGGRRVFACAKVEDLHVETGAGVDDVPLYLFAINHHDRKGGLKMGVGPYRIVCGNMERVAVAGAHAWWSIKHTLNHAARISEAAESLARVHTYAQAWTAEQATLAGRPVAIAEIHTVISDVLAEVFPERAAGATSRQETNLGRRRDDILERFDVEADRTGGATAYALERALTGHLDHAGERRPRGANKQLTPLALLGQAILEGDDDAKKATAHRRVMALVRR
jgi:phage/plasmid-like protein (TIGR03299 family)